MEEICLKMISSRITVVSILFWFALNCLFCNFCYLRSGLMQVSVISMIFLSFSSVNFFNLVLCDFLLFLFFAGFW